MSDKQLLELAIKASRLSYSPYSNFKVGAVVLTKDGEIFEGANIENSSYPLCMCAERNAIYNAYLHEKSRDDIVALALAANTDSFTSPCGACRQVMSELLNKDVRIIMGNFKGEIKITSIEELLPYAFSSEDLK